MKGANEVERLDLFNTELFPHLKALTNYAFHMTNNEEDARDLVQDTYMRAIKSLESFEKGTNAKAWLFKICKNGFINRYRQKARQPRIVEVNEVIIGDHSLGALNPGTVEDNLYLKDINTNMMGDEVSAAVNTLAPDYRSVILLCDIEEFSYEEISKILEIPIGTVRSRLHRARKLLKDKLKKYAIEFGYVEV